MKKFALPAKERIKSKKSFEKIYQSGKVILSSDKKIKATFLIENSSDSAGVQMAAAVFKKVGNAVWRNRVKRLIKEAYRLNKGKLIDVCVSKNKKLLMVISSNLLNQKDDYKICLNDILPGMEELIAKLIQLIEEENYL